MTKELCPPQDCGRGQKTAETFEDREECQPHYARKTGIQGGEVLCRESGEHAKTTGR